MTADPHPHAHWLEAAPPPTIRGAALILRRWRLGDLDVFDTAITESLDALSPWMEWAAGHERRSARQFLHAVDPAWRDRTAFNYAVVDTTGRVLGGAGLHARIGTGGLEIGYWVRTGATRRRVATRSAALLTAAALDLDGVDRTEIHHDRANELSGRVPRRLGYEQAETVVRSRRAPGESGIEVRWRMTSERYATSMARTLVAG